MKKIILIDGVSGVGKTNYINHIIGKRNVFEWNITHIDLIQNIFDISTLGHKGMVVIDEASFFFVISLILIEFLI